MQRLELSIYTTLTHSTMLGFLPIIIKIACSSGIFEHTNLNTKEYTTCISRHDIVEQ